MPVPNYQTLMLPVLKLLAEGPRSVADCVPSIRTQFSITDEEAAELTPSGRTTYLLDRAHWARTYLSKAGLVISSKRNLHAATPLGLRLLSTNVAKIDIKLLDTFDGFTDWRMGVDAEPSAISTSVLPSPAPVPQATPEEAMTIAHDLLDAKLRDDLLGYLIEMHPTRFERLILDLLSKMGFGGGDLSRARMTKASGDGGIDGIIHEDVLGLDRVYVQAKRYAPQNAVGSPAIQQFMGSLSAEGAGKGVFVTTSSFSKEARAYAARVPHLRIVLIDGQELARLLVRYGVGIRARTTYVVHGIDEEYFRPAAEG